MLYRNLLSVVWTAIAFQSVAASPVELNNLPQRQKRHVPDSHVLHERQMPHWSRTWQKKAKVDDSALLPMRVGLRQTNVQEGHDLLMDRSDPSSPNFGKRMSALEVIDFFAPPQESVDAVTEWLVSGGINSSRISQSANKQWIQFDASVAEVEDLLYTEYYWWEHGATTSQNIAAEEYHIPMHVQKHIDYITPGIRLRYDPGRGRRLKRQAEAEKVRKRMVKAMNTGMKVFSTAALPPFNSSVCDQFVTQQCIRDQYSIPVGDKAVPGNELGIFESLGDHYSKTDLDNYWTNLYPAIPNGTYPIEKNIDGAFGAARTTAEIGIESDLDFEAAQPLIYPQRTVLFQTDDEYYELAETTGDTPIRGFFNNLYDAIDGSYCTYSAFGETGNCVVPECLDPSYPDPNPGGYKGQLQCGVYEPTNVISISYGGGESDVPDFYVKRRCNEIMKLGLQGVTVVISSGDYGVGSFPGDPTPSGCVGPRETIFYPAIDAACPYVLAVGSTELVKATESPPTYTESATARFGSGGGFSNYFDAPDFQKASVATYFDTVSLNFTGYTDPGVNFTSAGAGVYKIGGRGYPDVSAIGDLFVTAAQGSFGLVGGTSLSAPIWAAVVTRINEERIAVGKGSLGFLNPTLYAHPEVFTDVTNGSNPNCGSTGFLAAKGWDPVTGLGTIDYPKLLSLLVSLP